MKSHLVLCALLPIALVSCASAPADPALIESAPVPATLEVERPAADGWEAVVALDTGDVGIWTVLGVDIADDWGGQEVIAADDEGRAWLLVPYSGRWTAMPAVHDRKWLGALAIGDFDPDHAGRELLAGGEGGNLYMVSYFLQGGADVRRVAEFPGEEIHTSVAGDFDLAHAGPELLVFTSPGAAYLMRGDDVEELGTTKGRVRDALLLEDAAETTVLTASRSGALERWVFGAVPNGPAREVLYQASTGIGRLTRQAANGPIYAGLDDGRILRIAASATAPWSFEVIHSGELGVRGVAAGDFDGSGLEQVAFCGYDGKVHLLSKSDAGAWNDLVIYDDEAKLHWLAAAELDGRNGTSELLCSGYGGRVVLLRRR